MPVTALLSCNNKSIASCPLGVQCEWSPGDFGVSTVSLITRFHVFFFYAVVLDVQLSSSVIGERWLVQLQPSIPGDRKKEPSQASIQRFPSISAERLVSTSHWQPLSVMETWANTVLLGLFPHLTKELLCYQRKGGNVYWLYNQLTVSATK